MRIYTRSRQYHAYIRNAQREYIYGEIEYNCLLTGVLTKSHLIKIEIQPNRIWENSIRALSLLTS